MNGPLVLNTQADELFSRATLIERTIDDLSKGKLIKIFKNP